MTRIPKELKKADIVIGIPSFHEAETIAGVVRRADEGLARYYPKSRAYLVNADESVDDLTKRAFLGTKTRAGKFYRYEPKQGKGVNMRNIFALFRGTRARALVTIDADVRSSRPDWVRQLAEPVMNGRADHVFPLYQRHQYDGTITNLVCYPVVRGVLGQDIRQPIGGEMGLSQRAVSHFLSARWPESASRYGVDILMALTSFFARLRIAESMLGVKRHRPSAPKLNGMALDVLSTMLAVMQARRGKWLTARGVRAHRRPPTSRKTSAQNGVPRVAVDTTEIERHVLALWKDSQLSIEELVVGTAFGDRVARGEPHALGADEWAELLVRALARLDGAANTAELAQTLRILYFIRVLTFVRETRGKSYAGCMREVERQAEAVGAAWSTMK